MKQAAAFFLISFIFAALFLSVTVAQNTFAKSAKDSKARRAIDKAIGQAVEGKFSTVKTVNISTYTAPNESITVYNKTAPGAVLPNPILPSNPPANQTVTPEGFKICMVGDFKDSKAFDAMTSCNYKVALGDNGYSDNLNVLKKISPDHCVIGNHDAKEDGSPELEQESLAYCGSSWWVKFGDSTLMIGINTNGDQTKQLNGVKSLLQDTTFMSGVKTVIVVSHKGGHTFPNAHHPSEAKDIYLQLEGNIPDGVKLIEIAGHNHNAAAAPAKGWYISGNGGKSFYSCGQDKD